MTITVYSGDLLYRLQQIHTQVIETQVKALFHSPMYKICSCPAFLAGYLIPLCSEGVSPIEICPYPREPRDQRHSENVHFS